MVMIHFFRVQTSAPGDLELSFPRAFVKVNGHPGKVGCVYQGMIWSQPPFLALAVAPEVPHLRSVWMLK